MIFRIELPIDRPLAVAKPTRTPVKLPGPFETAIRVNSDNLMCWFTKISLITGIKSLEREALSSPTTEAISSESLRIEILPGSNPISMAKISFPLTSDIFFFEIFSERASQAEDGRRDAR